MSKSKKEERLFGEERFVTTIYGDVMECIEYKRALDCTFQFIDEYGYTVKCQWSQAERKKNPSKAPFEKTLCGVACVGRLSNGEIPKQSSDVEIRALYRRYMNMLNRCYNNDGTVKVRDNGVIVTVHEDWLNFSTYVEDMRQKENYKEWQESGYSNEFDFDKDIECFLGFDTTKIVVRQYSNETVRIVRKADNLDFRKVTTPFYKYKSIQVCIPTTHDVKDIKVREISDEERRILLEPLERILGTQEVRIERRRKRELDRLVHEKIDEIKTELEQHTDNEIIHSLEKELERYEQMLITGEYDVKGFRYTLRKELLE